jgi:hypothetical protein
MNQGGKWIFGIIERAERTSSVYIWSITIPIPSRVSDPECPRGQDMTNNRGKRVKQPNPDGVLTDG